MKKERSDNILQGKMDAFSDTNSTNTRSFQPVWDRLEDQLHPKKRKKTIHFYFAAAAILLVLLAGGIMRYQLKDKPAAQLVIRDPAVKKTQQVTQPNVVADTFAHSAKPGQSIILINNSKKKLTLAEADLHDTALTKQNNPSTYIALPEPEVANDKSNAPSTEIISPVNLLAAAPPKKPTLKVLHINEIYHGTTVKPNESTKTANVNWVFTTNNIKPDIRDADNNYPPVTRKKSFFSIPLQKQNSD